MVLLVLLMMLLHRRLVCRKPLLREPLLGKPLRLCVTVVERRRRSLAVAIHRLSEALLLRRIEPLRRIGRGTVRGIATLRKLLVAVILLLRHWRGKQGQNGVCGGLRTRGSGSRSSRHRHGGVQAVLRTEVVESEAAVDVHRLLLGVLGVLQRVGRLHVRVLSVGRRGSEIVKAEGVVDLHGLLLGVLHMMRGRGGTLKGTEIIAKEITLLLRRRSGLKAKHSARSGGRKRRAAVGGDRRRRRSCGLIHEVQQIHRRRRLGHRGSRGSRSCATRRRGELFFPDRFIVVHKPTHRGFIALRASRLHRRRRSRRSSRTALGDGAGDVALVLVLVADELLYRAHRIAFFGLVNVRRKVCLPICVGSTISPLFHKLYLLVCPRIQINGTNETNVHTQVSVDARTLDAKEDTKVSRCPSRSSLVTVCTNLVVRLLEQHFESLS
mmetsp:Transcript_37111/g.64083  ORF Transcript_37111/g.64083 Transcript_37111/m.64083 type:complete len:438 (-) Transcript_37111:69-1382(-)